MSDVLVLVAVAAAETKKTGFKKITCRWNKRFIKINGKLIDFLLQVALKRHQTHEIRDPLNE